MNLDIINKTVMVGKIFKNKERDRKIEGLLNNKHNPNKIDKKLISDRERDKDKEMKKLKEEIERSSKKHRGEKERSR